ncbi:MAG: hemolysin [Herpetosiphonaceae bacterium]|nr:MAG: hemolysin [Herpetosiphonaceae bacterium]
MSPGVIAILLLLIAVNALYVAAEFAAVSVRQSRIQQLAENGHTMARRLLPIIKDPLQLDRYVAASQIGITLSSLIAGAVGQAMLTITLAPLFERLAGLQPVAARSTAVIVVLILLTTFQMVLGELVPKSVALQYPTQTALLTVLPMRWSLKLFSFFIAVLNGSGIMILRLLGFSQSSHRHIHSPEEIDLLIAESRDGGLLEPDEQRRLHQALHLSMRSAHHLMIPRVYLSAVSVDTPFERLVTIVAESPYTRLPVYEGSLDTIVGIIHTRDVAAHFAGGAPAATAADLMRPVVTAPETLTADRLLALMRERRSHHVIVIDEYGGVAGMVTLEDVLAELMGEVPDEFKLGQPAPERLPDGRVRLPGLMRLDEAEPWIGTRWTGESDTVAGRVIEAIGHLPDVGEQAVIDGVPVEVERIVNRAVVSVIACPVAKEEQSEDE